MRLPDGCRRPRKAPGIDQRCDHISRRRLLGALPGHEARDDLENAGSISYATGLPIDTFDAPDLRICPRHLASRTLAASTIRGSDSLAYLSTRARKSVRPFRNRPRFNLEGRARAGHDIDGFAGRTTDLQANVVMRWDLYNGGIKEANVREQRNRADEVHARLFERTRRAEEDTRTAWSRLQNQNRLLTELETQQRIADDLLLSYREQFNIGRRSLLDVLDAQNTRNNVQAQTETARLSKLYAQYRVLASSNRLIECLGVAMPAAALSDERTRFRVNPIPPADLDENSYPLPRMGTPAAPAGGSQ